MVMKRAAVTWIAFTLLFCWTGLLPAAPPPPENQAPPKAEQRDEKEVPGRQEAAEPRPEEYTYNPEGKTDPFDPFIVKKSQSLSQVKEGDVRGEELQKMLAILQDLKRPKTELQTFPLAAIKLTAILSAGNQTVAMVRGPEGGKGYMLKKGTYIGKNGGVVEKIINEETMTDLGRQLIRKVVIKEPYLDEKRKISYRHVELTMPGSFD
ncbi:MAG: pilus assembly protein PilP [Deltaproteobacteria bacterium]|nr:pilus assembly protein PilP [Deltaproteobacteria bacterium]